MIIFTTIYNIYYLIFPVWNQYELDWGLSYFAFCGSNQSCFCAIVSYKCFRRWMQRSSLKYVLKSKPFNIGNCEYVECMFFLRKEYPLSCKMCTMQFQKCRKQFVCFYSEGKHLISRKGSNEGELDIVYLLPLLQGNGTVYTDIDENIVDR